MSTDPIPVYGTPGGDEIDEDIPVYGTPTASEHPQRPPAAPPAPLLRRIVRGLRHRARNLVARDRGAEPDWNGYLGLVAGDADEVLGGIRLDDVLARDDRILSRVRRSLEAEFRVHWWANTDRESLEPQANSWGGESLLQVVRSATWRTTSNLTSVEDRDMATRIAGVVLAHEGLLAAEHEADFRIRALPFARRDS